jgi:hypothetical protein
MRRPIMVAAAVGTLAVGGAAIAVADGPTELFGGDPQRDFAEDLAAELGGDVTAAEVEDALHAVAEDRMTDRRREMAESIVEHLDGVTVEEVEAALAVVDDRMREGFESGDPPDPGMFAEVLAEELGVSDDQIEDALAAVREEQFDALPKLHREGFDELPRFRDEAMPVPPGGLGGRPALEFVVPGPAT